MEEKENKRLPYFSICFYTVLAIVNVYLFWCHPLGICIYWGLLALLAMWNVKEAADSDFNTPSVLVVWKFLQFGLFTILAIAFANRNHALAIAGMVTLFGNAFASIIFECFNNTEDVKDTIVTNAPFLIGIIIMIKTFPIRCTIHYA